MAKKPNVFRPKLLLDLIALRDEVDDGAIPRTERQFLSIWAESKYICRKIHYWLYVRQDEKSARRYLPRLKSVVTKLPEREFAIVAQEGIALLHALNGNLRLSLKYRKREIRMLEMLIDDIRESLRAGRLTKRQARQVLINHDVRRVKGRQKIVRALNDALNLK